MTMQGVESLEVHEVEIRTLAQGAITIAFLAGVPGTLVPAQWMHAESGPTLAEVRALGHELQSSQHADAAWLRAALALVARALVARDPTDLVRRLRAMVTAHPLGRDAGRSPVRVHLPEGGGIRRGLVSTLSWSEDGKATYHVVYRDDRGAEVCFVVDREGGFELPPRGRRWTVDLHRIEIEDLGLTWGRA